MFLYYLTSFVNGFMNSVNKMTNVKAGQCFGESAHLLEVGDGFFGGSARQRDGCGEDGGPDEGDRGSFFDGERSLRGCDARDAEGDRRAERERATGGVRYH